MARRQPAHPLGTDAIGRDILAPDPRRAAVAADRHAVVAVPSLVGIALGLVPGIFRGVVEIAIMRADGHHPHAAQPAAGHRHRRDPRPGPHERDAGGRVVVLPHYVRIVTRAAVIAETSKDYVTARARTAPAGCA